ncbi:HK97 gp10 family phage protein [Pleomorphomonas oryzae]|uniref:HK97 gp10 family phage protein n=1 Tax=Pleomorphomonas oryzae TaxID=261934 RepID=UPI0003FBA434|nr:HK97 gp10 family phage protein [Pleomorphomonas oryzae]
MAVAVSMKVRGKDRLRAKLQRLLPEAVFEEMTAAAIDSGNEMVMTAKNFVPVDTGGLRDSIAATGPGETTPPYSQPGGSMTVPEGAVMVTAGDTQNRIAHLVEYGTAPHINQGLYPGTQHPGTHPQPFFWPAYRIVRPRHQRRANKALRDAIKKVGSTGDG